MSTCLRRVTAVVTAALLTVLLGAAPASSLRLLPPGGPPLDGPVIELFEDSSLIMSTGRLAAYLSEAAGRLGG